MEEVETKEDRIGYIGCEIINGVPLNGTEMTVSMAPSPSPAEKQPTKKRPAQNIGCGRKTTETVSLLAYSTRDCIRGSRQ